MSLTADQAPAQVLRSGSYSQHTCTILNDGLLKCWGRNDEGHLGLGDRDHRGDESGEMGENLPVIDLGTGRTALSVAPGINHTCALLDNQSIKCWGSDFSGQLGLVERIYRGDEPGEMGDNLPAVDLGTGVTPVSIAAAASQSCAILTSGQVKCWGLNNVGQLGLGDVENRGDDPDEMGDNLPTIDLGTGRTATALSMGYRFVCALLDNGQVKCWGDNSDGYLGLGDQKNRGDEPGEMGDNLAVVDLGTGRTAVAIASGNFHTCAMLDDGQVKCWGWNYNGELGLGDRRDRGDGAGEMGDNLPTVDLGAEQTATMVAAGSNHTCVLLDDGSLKCWGGNFDGQLGLGDRWNRGDDANHMGDNLPTVDLDPDLSVVTVTAGFKHTCALLDNGAVKCWGGNRDARYHYGTLGLEDTSTRGDEPGEMGEALPFVNLGGPVAPLPVELTAFEAVADGASVHLTWQTVSETNNAGFEVQHDAGTGFQVQAFVPGHGTTTAAQSYAHAVTELAPGLHRFRLRQIDYDGAFEYSPIVEVAVEIAGAYVLSAPYPNPFNPHTRFSLSVRQRQRVTVAVYDLIGREVARLHEGPLEASQAHAFTFAAGGLPSGTYLVRAVGEQFTARQIITLAK